MSGVSASSAIVLLSSTETCENPFSHFSIVRHHLYKYAPQLIGEGGGQTENKPPHLDDISLILEENLQLPSVEAFSAMIVAWGE